MGVAAGVLASVQYQRQRRESSEGVAQHAV
jgi:hypothetical protein